jgi:hypothetical protein
MYEFECNASSSAPAADVWDVLVDATGWPAWTGLPTPTMDRVGEPPPWGLGSIRRFSWGPLHVEEEVVVWEPPHRYGYAVVGGVPIKGYRAIVTLAEEDGRTAISWSGRFERATVPGLSRPLRWFTKTQLQRFAHRLGRHAEELSTRR